MDLVSTIFALGLGIALFLVLLLLATFVESTSSVESPGRAVSESARTNTTSA